MSASVKQPRAKSPEAKRAAKIRRQGFDKSYVTEDGYVRVWCSQCEALVINGQPSHELGCPNARKTACQI